MEILGSLAPSLILIVKNCNSIPKKSLSILDIMLASANIGTHQKTPMTLPKTSTTTLTEEEWNELVALKEAITYRPASVSAQKMEKFAELMVRSLEGKHSNCPQ